MQCLLVTHLWNDALLLPFWLKHHRHLFDHGVVIYYESSDSTREILEKEVPEWDVVEPWSKELISPDLDRQVQAIEAEDRFKGWWKMCLTVTEYAFTPNLKASLVPYVTENPAGIGFYASGWGLVDTPTQRSEGLDLDIPILLQRQYGFEMLKTTHPFHRNGGRRFIHRGERGNYSVGRHYTYVEGTEDHGCLRLVRLFYVPFDEAGIQRKLRMKENVSKYDVEHRHSAQHFMSRDEMEADYRRLLGVSQWLARDPHYDRRFQSLKVRYQERGDG